MPATRAGPCRRLVGRSPPPTCHDRAVMAASSLPRYGGGHDTWGSRMSGLDDPAVRAWLARLETESAVLPVDRRAELRADVEELLAAAAEDAVDDDTACERVLAELGPPGGARRRGGRVCRASRRRPGRRGRRRGRVGRRWPTVARGRGRGAAPGLGRPGARARDRGLRAAALVRRHDPRAALEALGAGRQGARGVRVRGDGGAVRPAWPRRAAAAGEHRRRRRARRPVGRLGDRADPPGARRRATRAEVCG